MALKRRGTVGMAVLFQVMSVGLKYVLHELRHHQIMRDFEGIIEEAQIMDKNLDQLLGSPISDTFRRRSLAQVPQARYSVHWFPAIVDIFIRTAIVILSFIPLLLLT